MNICKLVSLYAVLLCAGFKGVASTKDEKCLGNSLMEAKHFKFLPDLKRQDTLIKGENYCNLKDKKSCCTEHELDTVKGLFVLADYYLNMEEYMNEKLRKHPDDLYFITLGLLSRIMDSSGVKVEIDDKMRREIKSLINAELKLTKAISDSVFTMANTVMSYAAGMTCTVCDPRASEYITVGENNTLELHLKPKMCDKFVKTFEEIVESFSAMFKNTAYVGALEDLLVSLCEAAQPSDFLTCDKTLLKALLEHVIEEIFSEKSIYEMICGSKDQCKKVLCGETLRGLGIDISTIAGNIKAFITAHCMEAMGCPQSKLLSALQELESLVAKSMTNGKDIQNVFPSNKKEEKRTLDVWSIGCSSKLSSRVCKSDHHDDDDDDDDDHKHKSSGSSVGIFFGVLFIVGGIGAAGVIFYRRRNRDAIDAQFSSVYHQIGENET